MAFVTARKSVSRGLPTGDGRGMKGSSKAHSASVRSLAYRKPVASIMSASDFGPGHRAIPRIFANPKESQLAEITHPFFSQPLDLWSLQRVLEIRDAVERAGPFSSLNCEPWGQFPKAKMCKSISDNPNRRLSYAVIAIGGPALDPESMQSRGGSRCDGSGEVVIWRLKFGVSPLERSSQRLVENRDAHVEKWLYGPAVPAHLLFFDHAL